MTVRNIKKSLAGVEDLAIGIGELQQERGVVHRVNVFPSSHSYIDMQQYEGGDFFRLYGSDVSYTDYRRNPTGTVGIPAGAGGVWEPLTSNDKIIGGNTIDGAYLADDTYLVWHASSDSNYAWTGALPHTVAPGTDPAMLGSGYVQRTDVMLRDELVSSTGLSLIGEVPDISSLRSIVGNAGDKVMLTSYNSGWAATSASPVGGGKFRWVADDSLVDDGVFIFKPVGASGAWVRQHQKKVTPYLAGAKGDNVDDTEAMLRCFNVATSKRLNVYIDKGQYKYTTTPIVGPECNISGELSLAELIPVGCDGIKFTASDAVGGRKVGGFVMLGTGANSAGYTAIVCDPGQDLAKRTTGVSFEDIQIFNFKTAGNFKNLWHSTFRSFNATNVCNGLIFRGRCISNEVGSGTKIVRGSGTLSSGDCIGVQFTESSDYSPAMPVRPEACYITQEVLIFGFDINVFVQSMLAGGIVGADIDFSRKYGILYEFWDGKGVIDGCWIAGDADYASQPYVGVGSMARSPALKAVQGPTIARCTLNVGNGNSGDCGIRLGSLNGLATIHDNVIGLPVGAAIYLDGADFNKIRDNLCVSQTPLFMYFSGANVIEGNYLGGGQIVNLNPISGNLWGRNSGEYFTEGVVTVPISAGATSGTLNLASLGYTRGVPTSGDRTVACYSVGTLNPGNTWADISVDGLTVTAYKTTAFGAASELHVRIGLI